MDSEKLGVRDAQALYLERVEAAAMGKLVEAINDGDLTLAGGLVDLLQELNIV